MNTGDRGETRRAPRHGAGAQEAVVAEAPGRVNLLGEHTDYNDGFVLPTAIPQKTRVSVSPNGGGAFRLYAAELDRSVEFTLDKAPEQHFATYVYGCLKELEERGASVPPLDIEVSSDVPIGVGLSSSAALEVAVLRATRELLGLALDDVELARLAQSAEIRFAGVRCGIMDQMASSLAAPGSMLFLDTRTLERRVLPLPEGTEILVADSGHARTLAGSGYNQRRAECEDAARLLNVPALRDVTDVRRADELAEPLRRRARHVITENARVLRACEGVDAREFGELMDASHASLRSDFEVSVPALDSLVAMLREYPVVYGARLTGAGFGGACVALCAAGEARAVGEAVMARYRDGRLLVPAA